MYVVIMPVGDANATVREVAARALLALNLELNQRYFSPEHEAFFEICTGAERAAQLARWHHVSWN
jgi:hypothetical protein